VKILRSKKYIKSLQEIMKYISKDSKSRAFNFRSELEKKINNLDDMPYKYRKSIYFENEYIRDMIHKGYTIVYKIDEEKDMIVVVGIRKSQESI
jgi:plasmid stabilization system protein ParE